MCFAKKWAPNEDAACDLCQYIGSEITNRFGLETRDLTEFQYSIGDYSTEPAQYRSVDVDSYARSSARAYLRKYHLDTSDEHELRILNRFRRSARYLVDIAYDILENSDFDAVISNDSGYLIGGVFLDVAHQHGIPACDVDVGFRPHSLLCGRMDNRSSLTTYSSPSAVQSRLSTPLDKKEEQQINSFMLERMSGENVRFDHTQLAPDGFSLESETTVYGAFTNLPWDASLTATAETAFDDVFEWLKKTVRYFNHTSESELIIKTHPAEELRETNESIYQWLEDHDVPSENITVLPPDTGINPYEFMKSIDTGIVWNSTSGLEMSYLGTPVIVAGDTHYRGYGFTYDADSSEDYISYLDSHLDVSEHMSDLATRYAHHLFIDRHIEFPFYESTSDGYIIESLNSDQKIKESSELDILIESILNNEDVSKNRHKIHR